MAKAIKVPIHLDAIVVERPSTKTDSGSDQGWAPAITVENEDQLFLDAGAGLEAGVHLHWALPDALCRAEQSGDSERSEFLPVPDLWLVIRYLSSAPAAKRKLVVWAVDSISGRKYVLQNPVRMRLPGTKGPSKLPSKRPGGKLVPLSEPDRGVLTAALRDPQINVRERQLISVAAQRNWQISPAHQTLLEQLLERRRPSLGEEIADLDELLERRVQRAERLTAAGFQDRETGEFPPPDDEDDPAPGPMWAAYYPNARNRFGLYDPLSDLNQGEGPVSYAVIGWYLDPEEDPLYSAASAAARRQFIESCSWDYKEPKTPRHGGVLERLPRVRDIDRYIEEIERLIDKITPEELFAELRPGGGLRDPGNIDPLPGGALDGFPEIPRDVFDAGVGMPNRQPDFVKVGAEAFDLAIGHGRDLTQTLAARERQMQSRERPGAGARKGPRMLGATPMQRPQAAQLLRNRQAMLEMQRQARLRGQQPAKQPVAQRVIEQPAKQPVMERPVIDQPLERPVIDQPLERPVIERPVIEQPLARPGIDGPIPNLLPERGSKLNRKLAAGATTPAIAQILDRKQRLALGSLATRDIIGKLADINIAIERRPSLAGMLAGQLGAAAVPNRIVCHGAVLGVPVKGSAGIYQGASEGIWAGKSTEAVLGSSYASTIADEIGSKNGSKPLLEALHAGLQDRLASVTGAERMPQLLHQNGFAGYHDDSEPRRYRVLMLLPGLDDEGKVVAIGGKAERPGQAATRSEYASQWRGRVDHVEVVEMLPAAADQRLSLRWLTDISPNQAIAAQGPASIPKVDKRWGNAEFRVVEDAKIRWWRPGDPVILLEGGRRDIKHGKDGYFDPNRVDRNGRFDADGQLFCRLTGQGVRENDIGPLLAAGGNANSDGTPVKGDDLVELGSFLEDVEDGLRATVRELVEEVALLDPSNQKAMSRVWAGDDSQAEMFETHCELWRALYYREVKREEIEPQLSFGGELPSIVAIKFKEPAWSPIMAEYRVVFEPGADRDKKLTKFWTLGNVEHEPKQGALNGPAASVYQGRAFPTPAAAVTLAEAIQDAVADSDNPDLRAAAAQVAEDLERLDVMGFSVPNIDEDVGQSWATHSGRLRIDKVRLIDTFGQVRLVDRLKVAEDDWAEGSRSSPLSSQKLLIRPRLPYLAQLHFRFMAGADGPARVPARDARPWLSPVCGYLLPDHVEHAIEVFDGDGVALGQIRHRDKHDRHVVWDPAPGIEPRLGDEASSIANPWLRQVIQGVLHYNAQLAADDSVRSSQQESALDAMIRVIDTVQDTVDRKVGRSEFIATLVGRPVAVVRAQIRLDAQGNAADPKGIEARLGALTQTDDGLYGYFVGNDYTCFHPPHGAVCTHARPALGDADPDAVVRPITHAYVEADPTVDLPLGQTVDLVLLMDPHAGVHATTGVLPRKRLMLERSHYEDALAKIAPTFQVGPVLLDPLTKAMPVPGLERYDWVWTRRERPAAGADGWSTSEVGLLPDSAVLPTQPMEIHEGWLRLKLEEPKAEG